MVQDEGWRLSVLGAELWGSSQSFYGLITQVQPGWASPSPQVCRGPVNAQELNRVQSSQETSRGPCGRKGSGVRVSVNEGNSACPLPMCVYPSPPTRPCGTTSHSLPPAPPPRAARQSGQVWVWPLTAVVSRGPSLSPTPSRRQPSPCHQTLRVGGSTWPVALLPTRPGRA